MKWVLIMTTCAPMVGAPPPDSFTSPLMVREERELGVYESEIACLKDRPQPYTEGLYTESFRCEKRKP